MNMKKPEVGIETIGLNSIRDYFINEWTGIVLNGAAEAQAFVSEYTKKNTQEELFERLGNGECIAAFIKNFDKTTIKFNEEDATFPVKLRIISIDTGIAVIYAVANRHSKGYARWLNAELEGQVVNLTKKSFPKKHIQGWMSYQDYDKLLCIDEVVKILNSQNLLEAFTSYNQYFDREQYHKWRTEYSIKFRMSRSRRQLVSNIVKAIMNNPKKK